MSDRNDQLVRDFVRVRMGEHYLKVAVAAMFILLATDVFGSLGDAISAQPGNLEALRLVRTALALLCAGFLPVNRFAPRLSRAYAALVELAFVVGFGHFLDIMVQAGKVETVAIPASYLLAHMVFITFASPFGGIGPTLMAAAQMAIAFWAFRGHEAEYHRFLFVTGLTLAYVVAFARRMQLDVANRARQTVTADLMVAPLDLVRRSLYLSQESLETALAPRERRCLCLASDWRGYQALSRTRPPEELATALEAYYEVCRDLLTQVFPEGRYYSDWCADELLVVLPLEDDEDAAPVARAALDFARRLIEAKQEFAEKHQLALAIDVGLAGGTSVVGLAGPRAHRKLMAIGGVAPAARRWQAVGKQLRTDLGARDRVVYGDEIWALAGDGAALMLPGQPGYFEEPGADSERSAA